ncbi:MAG: hypothetical protein AAFO03_01980 [Bacteroidota bacterium]
MNRRTFTQLGITTALGWASTGCRLTIPKKVKPQRPSMVNTLYYRANTFHYNPDHIKADLDWMAEHGTNALTMAISETDFGRADRNIATIVREAHARGIKVLFVTSRWAGIFAGAPKAPSLFAATHPHTWSLNENGQPYFHSSGPICSIYYPEVYEFFTQQLDEAFNRWGLDGVMWDEPKAYQLDFAPQALAILSEQAVMDSPYPTALELHVANYCDYISSLNDHLRQHYPDKLISFFAYPYLSDFFVDRAATIRHLDYFGADGRPYPNTEEPTELKGKKFLLGEGAIGFRYVAKAQEVGLKSMVLIENFKTKSVEYALLERYLDEIIPAVDQFAYYYYPRSCAEPDYVMNLITRYLKKYV